MDRFMRSVCTVIVVVLLLVVVAGSAQACQRGQTQNRPAAGPGEADSADDATWVCLTLVGGTALLAGIVWMGKLRRLLS